MTPDDATSSADQLPQTLCPQCARYAVELIQERERIVNLKAEKRLLRQALEAFNEYYSEIGKKASDEVEFSQGVYGMRDDWDEIFDGLIENDKILVRAGFQVGYEQGYVAAKRQLLGPDAIVLTLHHEAILGGKLRALKAEKRKG